jgi:hypothetical protein
MRFGRDIRQGAQAEEAFAVATLVHDPERPDVQRAWAATFADLDRLRALCGARGIRLGLVVFPFAFQLSESATDDPQRRLMAYARSHDVAALDLLPVLRAHVRDDHLAASDVFLDEDHPSPLGSLIVADALAEFVVAERLLAEGP